MILHKCFFSPISLGDYLPKIFIMSISYSSLPQDRIATVLFLPTETNMS